MVLSTWPSGWVNAFGRSGPGRALLDDVAPVSRVVVPPCARSAGAPPVLRVRPWIAVAQLFRQHSTRTLVGNCSAHAVLLSETAPLPATAGPTPATADLLQNACWIASVSRETNQSETAGSPSPAGGVGPPTGRRLAVPRLSLPNSGPGYGSSSCKERTGRLSVLVACQFSLVLGVADPLPSARACRS